MNSYTFFEYRSRLATGALTKIKGFTLIELMIVVAIISILLSISIPVYVGYREKSLVATCLSDVSAYKSVVSLGAELNEFVDVPASTNACSQIQVNLEERVITGIVRNSIATVEVGF